MLIPNPIQPIARVTGNLLTDSTTLRYVVFRCDKSWYAIPAIKVLEITLAPAITQIPHSSDGLLGICERNNEFIPILSLSGILGDQTIDQTGVGDHLLVLDGSSSWAISIDEVDSLSTLDSILPNERRATRSTRHPVLGTSIVDGKVINLLIPEQLYTIAEKSLEMCWRDPSQPKSTNPETLESENNHLKHQPQPTQTQSSQNLSDQPLHGRSNPTNARTIRPESSENGGTE